MEKLLPRHVEIIEMIDEELIYQLVEEYGTIDSELLEEKLKAMRILQNVDLPTSVAARFIKSKLNSTVDVELEVSEKELDKEKSKKDEKQKKNKVKSETIPKPPKMVRMANLCIVGGHAVNGVAEIHSDIVKDEVFDDFYKLWPEKFQNKTNGVTPRRWIRFCNPDLSNIITKWIGTEDWVLNTEKLSVLRKFADNEELQIQWRAAKRSNKMKVASFLKEKTGYSVTPDAMFDIQLLTKIHEVAIPVHTKTKIILYAWAHGKGDR